MNKAFWIVYGLSSPNTQFNTLKEAEDEAARLAAQWQGVPFTIMASVKTAQVAQMTWTTHVMPGAPSVVTQAAVSDVVSRRVAQVDIAHQAVSRAVEQSEMNPGQRVIFRKDS